MTSDINMKVQTSSLITSLPNPKVDFITRVNQFVDAKLTDAERLIYEQIISSIDCFQLSELKHKYKSKIDSFQLNDKDEIKYLDLPFWLISYLKRFSLFELNKNLNGNFLDIGSGPGIFCAIAQSSGFSAKGFDVDNEFYSDLCGVLNVDRYICPVLPMVPLEPCDIKYSVITIIAHCFDNIVDLTSRKSRKWSRNEWQFFFNDLVGRLDTNGKLVLDLNFRDRIKDGMSISDIYNCLPEGMVTTFIKRPNAMIFNMRH